MPRYGLFAFTIFFLTPIAIIKAGPTYVAIDCPNATDATTPTYAQNSTYQTNLNTLFSVLSSNSNASNGFYNFTAGTSPPDIAYGLFLCRGDVSAAVCQDCVSFATTDVIERCPTSKRVTIWYDQCLFRYSNQSIFGFADTGSPVSLSRPNNVTNATSFSEVLGKVMADIAGRASSDDSGKKFATAEANYSPLERVYGLAQCTPDLLDSDCNDCLWYGISTFPDCCDASRGARVLFPSCYVRYEMSLFYLPPTTPSITGKGGILWRVLVGVIVPIGVIGFCFMCCRTKKKYYFSKPHASKDEITSLQSLQYDLSTVRAATNNFSDDNKIGMGGFGPVYKGTLPNGEEVAVKRLSKNSRQGVEQFKNEVVLIAKIQHVNLVRLLGFCLEGEEKILIYEFLPNKSLDKFLFDSQEQEKLGWPQRYNIIQGIAHGMLYLHEYSSLRIIHRDLKAGNILLDGNMNAKISDFGMARIFDMDQTRAITSRVVGTYGYISPEYAMHGQFSVKSDVFSFGVLLLEVISGKKTNSFYKPDCVENLLSYAWKLWNDGTPLELMDQALEGFYSRNEVHRCIHIGLLCVQHNPDARPSMAKVVGMLNRYSSMSLPQQPAFFAQSRTTSSTLQGLELDRQANTVACE